MVVTKFSDPDPSGPVFYYDPPTNISFGSGPPNVRDPYEVKWVQLVRILCYCNAPQLACIAVSLSAVTFFGSHKAGNTKGGKYPCTIDLLCDWSRWVF